MVSTLNPPAVMWSPTGMLMAATRPLGIGLLRVHALVVDEGDDGVDQEEGLEGGQPGDHAPADLADVDDQGQGDDGAGAEAEEHAPGERLAPHLALRAGEPQGRALEDAVV